MIKKSFQWWLVIIFYTLHSTPLLLHFCFAVNLYFSWVGLVLFYKGFHECDRVQEGQAKLLLQTFSGSVHCSFYFAWLPITRARFVSPEMTLLMSSLTETGDTVHRVQNVPLTSFHFSKFCPTFLTHTNIDPNLWVFSFVE